MSSETSSPGQFTLQNIEDKAEIAAFMTRYWGSPRMVAGMHVYDVGLIEATGLYDTNGELIAFASWALRDRIAYLCALHSLKPGRGIARHFLRSLLPVLAEKSVKSVRAMITNDNLPALAFYQKNGFRLTTLYVGAVDAYRSAMPGMLKRGYKDIPIHDTLEMELVL